MSHNIQDLFANEEDGRSLGLDGSYSPSGSDDIERTRGGDEISTTGSGSSMPPRGNRPKKN